MEEQEDILKRVILEIRNFNPQIVKANNKNKAIELYPYSYLTSDISGGTGALFIRAILNQLAINEHHIFSWRLENKYIQYLILNYYLPGFLPKTVSLSRVLDEKNGILNIERLLESSFFLKATLGHGSFSTNSFDKTAELDNIILLHQRQYDYNEKWILQKKLELKSEYRVHTFQRDVIYGLTFIIHGEKLQNSYADVEKFVEGILMKLPDTIVQGALIGWDIGLTSDDKYYIIEANFTGFHPEYVRGFQTSGYFEDKDFGPIICAWLNSYFKCKYAISVLTVAHELLSEFQFYKEFMFYSSIFKNEHIDLIWNKNNRQVSVIIYLGSDLNSCLITLIRYFQRADFAEMYYVIVNEESSLKFSALFERNNNINTLTESSLFKNNQYQLIQQLSCERRKQICCYHAIRHIKKDSYIIV